MINLQSCANSLKCRIPFHQKPLNPKMSIYHLLFRNPLKCCKPTDFAHEHKYIFGFHKCMQFRSLCNYITQVYMETYTNYLCCIVAFGRWKRNATIQHKLGFKMKITYNFRTISGHFFFKSEVVGYFAHTRNKFLGL